MSATRPRRGIRAKTIPETIPADLLRIDTLSSRDDVNVGEGRAAFLLDRERESPGADETSEGHASPGERLADDVHDFAEWLGYTYYRATESEKGPGRAASDTAIRTARVVLTGIAKNDGDERQVFLRAARDGAVYYLDLGTDDWRAVEISAAGWRLVDRPPVHFWRATTSRPLPIPVHGGDLSLLWRYATALPWTSANQAAWVFQL